MIQNFGDLAVRSRCSVQIQKDPLLIGYGQEGPTLQKEGVGRLPVFSKKRGEFKELVRHPRGRCLVEDLMYSCASLHVRILFSKFSLAPILLPDPISRDYFVIPSMMDISLGLALVYGVLDRGCGPRQRP